MNNDDMDTLGGNADTVSGGGNEDDLATLPVSQMTLDQKTALASGLNEDLRKKLVARVDNVIARLTRTDEAIAQMVADLNLYAAGSLVSDADVMELKAIAGQRYVNEVKPILDAIVSRILASVILPEEPASNGDDTITGNGDDTVTP